MSIYNDEDFGRANVSYYETVVLNDNFTILSWYSGSIRDETVSPSGIALRDYPNI